MPGTASAASSAAAARATSASVSGSAASARSSGDRIRRSRRSSASPAIRVLRHHPRHRDGALRELARSRAGSSGGGGDDGGALAHEHPQAEIAALGPLDMLGLARAGAAPRASAGDQHRVRRIGPGAPGARAIRSCSSVEHRPSRRQLLRDVGERRDPRGRAERRQRRAARGTAARRRAARRPVVTALIFATVSAVGMTRPNTWICRASCSQRLPVLSSDISSVAFTCARARASSASRHVGAAPCAAPPA